MEGMIAGHDALRARQAGTRPLPFSVELIPIIRKRITHSLHASSTWSVSLHSPHSPKLALSVHTSYVHTYTHMHAHTSLSLKLLAKSSSFPSFSTLYPSPLRHVSFSLPSTSPPLRATSHSLSVALALPLSLSPPPPPSAMHFSNLCNCTQVQRYTPGAAIVAYESTLGRVVVSRKCGSQGLKIEE